MNSDTENGSKLPVLGAFPWYPILFAVYAPLALLAHNLGQIEIRDGMRAILVTVFFALALLILARLLAGDWKRAAAVVAVVVILLVTYGHVYTAVKNYEVSGLILGRHRYLVAVWAVLAGLGTWWALAKSARIPSLTASMNLAAVALLIYPSFQLISYAYSSRGRAVQAPGPEGTVQAAQSEIKLVQGGSLPDVYYIILDAYGRSDVLLDHFNYDNSAFLDALGQMGFYIAACAQSNYSKTDLSLSSSLNLDYVTSLVPGANAGSTDRLPLWKLIKNSRVKAMFESLGYTTVAFDTGYDFTEVDSSDVYYPAPANGFNGFENLYLQTTIAAVLDDFHLLQDMQLTPADRKRELILSDLAELQKLPASVPGPKFVFAHLVIPHQPFVFGPDGKPLVVPERVSRGQTYYSPADYARGYRNQAAYISQQILEVIRTILKDSPRPPVIIVQGDHGPSRFEQASRMSILNAYYFPDGPQDLYPAITPVNSFRLLFRRYFNADLDLLEDTSYFSEYPYAYRFTVVPNECRPGVR